MINRFASGGRDAGLASASAQRDAICCRIPDRAAACPTDRSIKTMIAIRVRARCFGQPPESAGGYVAHALVRTGSRRRRGGRRRRRCRRSRIIRWRSARGAGLPGSRLLSGPWPARWMAAENRSGVGLALQQRRRARRRVALGQQLDGLGPRVPRTCNRLASPSSQLASLSLQTTVARSLAPERAPCPRRAPFSQYCLDVWPRLPQRLSNLLRGTRLLLADGARDPGDQGNLAVAQHCRWLRRVP